MRAVIDVLCWAPSVWQVCSENLWLQAAVLQLSEDKEHLDAQILDLQRQVNLHLSHLPQLTSAASTLGCLCLLVCPDACGINASLIESGG